MKKYFSGVVGTAIAVFILAGGGILIGVRMSAKNGDQPSTGSRNGSSSSGSSLSVPERMAQAQESVLPLIGKEPPMDFLVRREGEREAFPIRSLFTEESVVLVYTEKCPPCRAAINQYVAQQLATTKSDAKARTFYALSFEAQDPLPPGFPSSRFLRSSQAQKGSMFESEVSPTLWLFDSSGKLRQHYAGYGDLRMKRMLTGELSAIVSASDRN